MRAARTPILILAVGTVLTFLAGFVTQELTTRSQNHQKRLELKTSLASEIDRSFTTAVGIARSVGTGTVFSSTGEPVTRAGFAAAYNRGLGEWQINSAGVTAELSARFDRPLVDTWREYSQAVANLFRVAAVQPPGTDERLSIVSALRRYVSSYSDISEKKPFDWRVLKDTNKRFSKVAGFTKTYRALSDWILARGDQLIRKKCLRSFLQSSQIC